MTQTLHEARSHLNQAHVRVERDHAWHGVGQATLPALGPPVQHGAQRPQQLANALLGSRMFG